MFQNDAQRARACLALLASDGLEELWSESGPAERALRLVSREALPRFSEAERAVLYLAFALWDAGSPSTLAPEIRPDDDGDDANGPSSADVRLAPREWSLSDSPLVNALTPFLSASAADTFSLLSAALEQGAAAVEGILLARDFVPSLATPPPRTRRRGSSGNS